MNLFDNIFNPVGTFLDKQAQPQAPVVPQAPRTAQYVAPNTQTSQPAQKPSMTLFSDEQQMFQKMKADNLSDQQATDMLKRRRSDLLGGKQISLDESKILLRMQADNIPVKQAVAMIQKRRQDMETKANSIHDLHADEGVVEQTLKAPFRAIGDVGMQALQGIGKGAGGLVDATFRGVNDLNKMVGSSDYSPELERQLPQGGYLSDAAKAGAGITSSIFNVAKTPLALGINTANQLPGAQYITQGIGKGIEYGAENLGEMVGVDKETSMDLATTGMNLLGMKPGMNTLQYGKGIANAKGVIGKTDAIVKPVGSAVVDTVKMPYDIVKGAVNLAQKIPNPLPKGANISTRANRFTAGDEGKFIAQMGETPGEFATSRGMTDVGEKAIEKAQQNFEKSKSEADTAFDAIQGKFTTKGSSNDILGDLLKANKEKMDAQPRNKDSARVNELLSKYESGEGLTMSEINDAKRIHARNHTYSYEQRTSNEARNASDIQNDIRDWQFQTAKENGFTNADKINMETKGWKMYADSLAKKMDRSGANNAIGITDWIALSGGNPANVALFLGKKAASSNLIKTGAIKLFSKKTKPSIIEASKADIQQANFEKNVNRGISGDMNSAGGKSMVKPRALLPAPTGKATGARNFRANQPMEKSPIKNDKQVGERQVKKESVKLSPQVKPVEKTSATQANGPRVIGKMGKVETNTTLQSPTSYEEGIRRPFTMGNNKPIVKRASDVDSGLIEEKIPKPDEKFLAKFAEGKTLDEFMGFVRGSSTQYGGYEPRLRRYLRPESKRLNELVPKDPNTRMITIYRGIDKSENPRIKSEIKGGDFVTTSYDDALSYADSPANVVSKRVPISTLVTEFPEEFIKNNKGKSIGEIVDYELIWKPYDHPFIKVTDNQLKQIYEQAKSPQKTVKPLTPKKQSATMGDMETKKLIEEARKYKSAEEFIKAQDLQLHGSPNAKNILNIDTNKLKGKTGELGEGFYLTNDAKKAGFYKGEGENSGIVGVSTKGLKIYITSKRGADGYVQETIKYGGPEKFRKYLESKGYEGIETLDNNETVIFPSAISKLKTESQLKKIWEQANKKTN